MIVKGGGPAPPFSLTESACLHTFIVVLLYLGMKNNVEQFKKINKELFLNNFIEAQKMELKAKPSAVFESWRMVENKHISDLESLIKEIQKLECLSKEELWYNDLELFHINK